MEAALPYDEQRDLDERPDNLSPMASDPVVAPPPEDSWEKLEAEMTEDIVCGDDCPPHRLASYRGRITALREKDRAERIAYTDDCDVCGAGMYQICPKCDEQAKQFARIRELEAERDRLKAVHDRMAEHFESCQDCADCFEEYHGGEASK